MKLLPESLEVLIGELSKWPGVGERSALRYALALLRSGQKNINDLKRALDSVSQEISNCPKCHFWSPKGYCPLCESHERDSHILCVVGDNPDVLALERFRRHNWQYHILQGLLSPLNGVGPENIQIDSLFARIKQQNVKELILALDATIEGDATALSQGSGELHPEQHHRRVCLDDGCAHGA